MARRTKEWWAKLQPWERSWLVNMERISAQGHHLGGGGYLPDDCGECDGCGDTTYMGSLCPNCKAIYERILEKTQEE